MKLALAPLNRRSTQPFASALIGGLLMALIARTAVANDLDPTSKTHHKQIDIDGISLFYREAGPQTAPTLLLLHGYGASSHMFRDLIPKLASRYRLLAPDLPGFGLTTIQPGTPFRYSFDNLATVIDKFTKLKGLDRYAMYVFDYGAPVGWRLAVMNPNKITAVISQNGNAYEEGLSAGWADIKKAWQTPTPTNLEALRRLNTLDMIKWQYTEGVEDPSVIPPESYQLAHSAIARLGENIQVDLIMDYASNIKQYGAVQQFFRQHRPPTFAIWGKNDPFFSPAGATAFKTDNPQAEIRLLDTGHFALETHGPEIAESVLDFLRRRLDTKP